MCNDSESTRALEHSRRGRSLFNGLPGMSAGSSGFATRKECDVDTRKQLTVFLENKPGRLAQILSALAQSKINIVALAVMDRQEQGVLRLVTEDDNATRKLLKDMNQQCTLHDVLAVELRNQPGALARVCETL